MKKTATFLSILLVTLLAVPGWARVETGAQAPDFTLTDTNGVTHSLSDFEGKHVVLEWTNHQCPFVVKHYASGNMQELQKKYTEKGVVWLTIVSSAPGQQGYVDADKGKKLMKEHKFAATAKLLDPEGEAGRTYAARTTPHMYVISPEGKLIYQGAIDDDRSANPKKAKTAHNYVAAALDASMKGEEIKAASTQPYGCSVKYAAK